MEQLERLSLTPDPDQVPDPTTGREAGGENPAEPAVLQVHLCVGRPSVHDTVGLAIQVEVDDPEIGLELDAPAFDIALGEPMGEHHTLEHEVDPEDEGSRHDPEAIGGREDLDQLDGEQVVVEAIEVLERPPVCDQRDQVLDRPGSLTQELESQVEDPPIVRVELILQHRLTLAVPDRRRKVAVTGCRQTGCMTDRRHTRCDGSGTTGPADLSLVTSPLRRAIDRGDHYSGVLKQLAAVCGGVDVLEALRDDPIPDEPFDPSGMADDHRALAVELLETIETAFEGSRLLDRLLDDQHRTISRRLVAAAVTHPAQPLRRKAAPQRMAVALVWIMLRGNMQLGPRGRLTAGHLWDAFGVGNCSDLGRSIAQKMRLLAPTEIGSYHSLPSKNIALGDVRLLHSTTRSTLIQRRDEAIELGHQLAATREKWSLVTVRDDGTVSIRARDLPVIGAAKALSDHGRATVMMLFGSDAMNPDDVIGISVPDAHQLISALQHALDAPLTASAS